MANARRGREARLVSRCRVEFDRPSGVVEAETEDLSARGLFIRTEALLPVGEETEIRLYLPDGTLLGLRARVAHMLTPASARALGRHAGMGFELIGHESTSRLKLRAHLDTVKTESTNPGLVAPTQALVIEPAPPLRARMTRCLESAGFKVTAVGSATDAFVACAAWRPDVIVSAAQMDGMTGTDLAFAVSDHELLAGVPIVLAGDDGDLGRLEAFRAGVRDFVPKPFLDEELVIRVHRVVAPIMQPPSTGLRGNLVDIGLGALLSLFEFERKSGILAITRDNDTARMFVAEGRILKIETTIGNGKMAAKTKMLQVLDWGSGQFEFTPSAVSGRDELKIGITQLLLEHARERDEDNDRRDRATTKNESA